MNNIQKKSVTLIELIIAILLLSVVLLTGVTVELALRRMQVKPSIQTRLLNELIPVIAMMRKDFEKQIGSSNNPGLYTRNNNHRLEIRVDVDNTGNVSSGDQWHAYNWIGTPDFQLRFSINNFTNPNYEVIAEDITNFNVSASSSNTTLTVQIGIRKDPAIPEDPLTNPAVNLTTTMFSRMVSVN